MSNVSPILIITCHAGPYAVHATFAMLSLLRKYTIDYFLPPWLNIFHDVTRSVWENEWKTAGDSSVPCCGCFITLLVKSNDAVSFLQSQTQVTYSVNFYFSQHTHETCTVREIAYCLREKVIAFAGRQQCTCWYRTVTFIASMLLCGVEFTNTWIESWKCWHFSCV